MKAIYKLVAALVLGMVVFASCEDYLDTKSYTESNTSNFPASEQDAMQLVTGIYNALNGGPYEPSASYFIMAMTASDECFGGGGQDDYDIQAYDHLLYFEPNSHLPYWESYYSGIARANMAIENLDKVENEEMRNQLLGEAYFLRSYLLFELTQMCGEIPLLTSVPNSVDEAAEYPAQASIEEIYGTIAAGLQFAIKTMPSYKWNNCISGLRHATKWDAEAMLARVYLFYTGFYSDKNGTSITTLPVMDLETNELGSATIGKDEVVRGLEDCIANSGHELVSDFRLMWPYMNSATKADYVYAKDIPGTWITDDVNPEEMFSICVSNLASSSRYRNKYDQYLGVRKRSNYEVNAFPFSRGYGMATVNPYVWQQWDKDEPGDIRKAASIYYIYDEMEDADRDYTWGNDQQMEETGYWQKKYQAWGAMVGGKFFFEFSSVPEYGGAGTDLGRGYSPQNIQIIRFADVLLMHSELTDGKVVYNGKSGMNAVRSRVGLPDVAYSVDALRKERQHELAFEGIRWSDMRRYGKAYCIAALKTQLGQDIRNNSVKTVMKDQGPGYEARYEATWGFRPFPQSEISLSAGVLKQNPGWTESSAQYTNWK